MYEYADLCNTPGTVQADHLYNAFHGTPDPLYNNERRGGLRGRFYLGASNGGEPLDGINGRKQRHAAQLPSDWSRFEVEVDPRKKTTGMKKATKQYLRYLNYMATDEFEQNTVHDEHNDICKYARCFSTYCPKSKNPDQAAAEFRDPGFQSLMDEDLPMLFNEDDL